jgi:hypothetical protein
MSSEHEPSGRVVSAALVTECGAVARCFKREALHRLTYTNTSHTHVSGAEGTYSQIDTNKKHGTAK